MELRIKKVNISSGGPLIVIIHKEDARKLDLKNLDRIKLKSGRSSVVTAVDIAKKDKIKEGYIGLFTEVFESLNVKENEKVFVEVEPKPLSLQYIKKKLDKQILSKHEIDEIIKDIISNKLTEIEMTYFVSACYINGLTLYESSYLTEAILESGSRLKLNKYPILDKHCIPADTPTIVRNSGNVKVDNIFDKCAENEIYFDGEAHYTDKNLNNLHAMVHDDNGRIKFVPVSAVY